jgi:hypothetical protein
MDKSLLAKAVIVQHNIKNIEITSIRLSKILFFIHEFALKSGRTTPLEFRP